MLASWPETWAGNEFKQFYSPFQGRPLAKSAKSLPPVLASLLLRQRQFVKRMVYTIE